MWYNLIIRMNNMKQDKIYKKLVRDRIPEMIEENNQVGEFYIFPESDFEDELTLKMQEEIGEYLTSKNPEELADILEILMELAKIRDIPFSEIETIRQKKLNDRGGFSKRIFLVKVRENEKHDG
jgi:predicted house-cleaning noncanonical NTP pyrophosphatase (MazG superfamily)